MANLLSLSDDLLTVILQQLYTCDPEHLITLKYQSHRLYRLCLPFIFACIQISSFQDGSERTTYVNLMRSLKEHAGLFELVRCVDLKFTRPRSNECDCELVGLIEGDGKWTRKEINDRGWCLTGPGEGVRCVYYREGVDWKGFLGWN